MDKIKTVLYVDDDEDDREIFRFALEKCQSGLSLKTARDGLDALKELASDEPPVCIYIDINMPKMNGMEFLRIVKSNRDYCSIPAFIFSTTLDPNYIDEARRLGATDFFVKPTSFQSLVAHLKSCLSRYLLPT